MLLIDEKLGARLARERGLNVIGTLGILVHGSLRGLVDINTAVDQLQANPRTREARQACPVLTCGRSAEGGDTP